MIYLFDKQQNINGMLSNDDLIEGELKFKINNATTFSFTVPLGKEFDNDKKYIAVPHPNNNSKYIMMKLMSRTDNIHSVDYTASELAYQELSSIGYIQDKRPLESDAKTLMNMALDGSGWSLGVVNISGTTKTNFYYISYLEAVQKVIGLLGGEVYFYITISGNKITGRYMDYVYQQGTDTSKVFANGSNLLIVVKTQTTSEIYTAILPRGKGEQVSEGEDGSPDGYGRRIDISSVEWKKSDGKPLDKANGSLILEDPTATAEWGQINGNARLLLETYDEIDDVNTLIQSAYNTLMSVNHPQIEYSATVADVGDLSLGDTVLIMHNERNLNYKTRVFEINYDLVKPENTTLSLGDDLSSNSITSQINTISSATSTVSEQTQWNISNGGHNNTSYGGNEPTNPKKGDVWYKALPNGNTEMYYYNGSIWVLGATTDQQWQENRAIAQGSNTVFYGTDTPVGAVVGDTWFKTDNNEPNGKAMYTYSGSTWVKFEGGADASRLQIGTIDAAKINVMNISADDIVTGTLSANFIKGGQLDFSQINGININAQNIIGENAAFVKASFDSAYSNVVIDTSNISLSSLDGSTVIADLQIGNKGIVIKMPGISSFLDSTIINSNGMSFQHNGGSYSTVGVMDAGFTLEHNKLGGASMSIRIGDGVNNMANDMAFAISAAQNNGTSPQLIWAGSEVGKVSTKYRTWNNPYGFIIADNIKFSTWDNTASKVEVDDTVTFYNYAPTQVYGQRFSDGTTRDVRLGGKDISSGGKWFGFLNGSGNAGFGIDQTDDVWFFVKGVPYSLFTMLGKLGMR